MLDVSHRNRLIVAPFVWCFQYILCTICNCCCLLEFAMTQDIGTKARQSMCWWQHWCQVAQNGFGEQMHQYEEAGWVCTRGCCCLNRKGWVTVKNGQPWKRAVVFNHLVSHYVQQQMLFHHYLEYMDAFDLEWKRFYFSWRWTIWILSDWLECIIIMD